MEPEGGYVARFIVRPRLCRRLLTTARITFRDSIPGTNTARFFNYPPPTRPILLAE